MDGLTHMTLDRQNMQEAIKRIVVPEIRTLGFKGSLPHFRRRGDGEHQLLMLFFNKYGGSFYVEAGRVSDQRVRELQRLWEKAGNSLAESSLTVGHCSQRARLGPNGFSAGQDHWFVFGPDNTGPSVYRHQPESVYNDIAKQVASRIKQHEASFFGDSP
jgi:hypothetical protein